ncbi:metallophosphoesterase [Radiobacillus kanasensis]|uniref:metallophosphoesterase n=1 Tax=Radiobacillus kanasensis TaxID=2844358 RepID=UPI001E42B9B0|nr:metallophosphoesterase [Radiobacillus kanasensis]UFT97649.1 metallophosphoesterase [Radiobacillus kanasensis]
MLFWIIGFLLIILFCSYMMYKAHHDMLNKRIVVLDSYPKDLPPMKIFFISDIHKRTISMDTIRQVEDEIQVIIIGGDLVEKRVPFIRLRENLRRLRTLKAPIYFVWGNNDYEVDQDHFKQVLAEENVRFLCNNSEQLPIIDKTIRIVGFDDYDKGHINSQEALSGPNDCFTILVSHNPRGFIDLPLAEAAEIDFVLSGHTHGGQIRIFGIGPYSRGGLKKYHSTPILVSEGYGFTKLPFRLGTNAECHLLTITS